MPNFVHGWILSILNENWIFMLNFGMCDVNENLTIFMFLRKKNLSYMDYLRFFYSLR
jgi:hypothetical protein